MSYEEIPDSDLENSEDISEFLINPGDIIQAIDAHVHNLQNVQNQENSPDQAARSESKKKDTSIDPDAYFDLKVQAICFTCGICQDIMNQPTTITCQHSFCYGCLEQMIKNNRRQHQKNTCPICKEVFLLPKSTAKNIIIDDLIIKCLTEEMRQLRNREAVKISMREEIRQELRDELLPVMMRRPLYVPHSNDLPPTFPPPGLENLGNLGGRIVPPHIREQIIAAAPNHPANLDYALVDRAVRIIDSRTFRWSILAIAGVMTGYTVKSMYEMIRSMLS